MTSPPPAYSEHHGDAQPPRPPPLPPRQPDASLKNMASKDPRSSSQQSLVPESGADDSGRRKLLLVYIHGFMGDETSFRNFPAHVHNLVTITLADTHLVYSKIYPKYRSRYAIEVARDDFSKWLTPHETRTTDIILLGHSMGGLLSADIALLFQHNIVGVINFDVPFLGMHPGIVKAGLGSIFKPWPAPEEATIAGAPTPEGKRPSRMDTLFNPKPSDPNYNPSFYNDVQLPVRKGWENALHFMNKHSNGLISASKNMVKSHIEFGGAMADYRELKDRYARVRALEEENEGKRKAANPGFHYVPRIRFVNYYTVSTGRPKKPKSPKSPSPSRPASRTGSEHPVASTASLAPHPQLALTHHHPNTSVTSLSPRISVEEHRGDEVVPVSPEEPLSATDPIPIEDDYSYGDSSSQVLSPITEGPQLPELPPVPQEPPFVDIAQFSDKAERKTAEKEHERALKDYQRAVKARNAIIKERTKMEEKWRKQKEQRQKQEMQRQKREEEEEQKRQQKEQQRPPVALTHHEQEMKRLQEEEKRMQAEQRRLEGKPPIEENTDDGHQSDNVEEKFGGMQLGAGSRLGNTSANSPYGNFDFSRSGVLAQAHPDERSSLADSSRPSTPSYADSTHTLTTQNTNDSSVHDGSPSGTPQKPKRLKKFCMLPPKDAKGNKDPTWVEVYVENADEVQAHTTLFFLGETYEMLVGEVAARIEDWIRENDSMRVARELEGLVY